MGRRARGGLRGREAGFVQRPGGGWWGDGAAGGRPWRGSGSAAVGGERERSGVNRLWETQPWCRRWWDWVGLGTSGEPARRAGLVSPAFPQSVPKAGRDFGCSWGLLIAGVLFVGQGFQKRSALPSALRDCPQLSECLTR